MQSFYAITPGNCHKTSDKLIILIFFPLVVTVCGQLGLKTTKANTDCLDSQVEARDEKGPWNLAESLGNDEL